MHLRLGLYRRPHNITQICDLINVDLVSASYDRLINLARGTLSAHGHATSLSAQNFWGERLHLFTLDRVCVRDYALAHLILSPLDCVACDLGVQEWPHDLLDLLVMIRLDLFDKGIVLSFSPHSSQRDLLIVALRPRLHHRALTLALSLKDRIKHAIGSVRRLHEAVTVTNSLEWLIQLIQIQGRLDVERFHFLEPI